jgi:SsrA-binding protein
MEKKIICQNKKAFHEYTIDEVIEAGVVLLGPEVKSLRGGRANMGDAYSRVKDGEVFVYNMHISPYPYAHYLNLDPLRTRKLLLNRGQIKRLLGKTKEKGYALIPLKAYFLGSKIKIELGLAKGKKSYDKRQSLKEKEMKREMDHVRKRRNY